MECGILLFFLAASAVGFGEGGQKAAVTGIYMSNSVVRFPSIGARETVDLDLFYGGCKNDEFCVLS